MACMWPPKNGAEFKVYFSLYNSADGTIIANPGSYTRIISIDGGAVDTTPTNAIVEEDTTYGQLSWTLSAAEMTGDAIFIMCKDDTAGCIPFTACIYTTSGTWDELSTEDDIWAADTRTLTAIDEDDTTLDLNATLPVTRAGVKKNTELANFTFFMALSSDHVSAATGKTVAGARSIGRRRVWGSLRQHPGNRN